MVIVLSHNDRILSVAENDRIQKEPST